MQRRFLTIGVVVQTVDAEEGVGVFDLSGSDLCHGLDGIEPTVLSQCHWDYFQSVSKRPHGILFQCWTLKRWKVQKRSWVSKTNSN